MLATQKGRSKPSRISWSLWLKLMTPPGMRGGMIAERGYPTPGRFCQRVRKRLKRKELSFWFVQKKCKRAQKSAQEYENKGDRGWEIGDSGPSALLGANSFPPTALEAEKSGKNEPLPPCFFGTAHSKGVAGERRVSAHSTGLKVAVFSVGWEWRVSADSKGVTGC